MNRDEARKAQAALIDTVRAHGFKDGGGSRFTDAQIWQAIMDERTAHPDTVAVRLVEQVIEGDVPASAPGTPEDGYAAVIAR